MKSLIEKYKKMYSGAINSRNIFIMLNEFEQKLETINKRLDQEICNWLYEKENNRLALGVRSGVNIAKEIINETSSK